MTPAVAAGGPAALHAAVLAAHPPRAVAAAGRAWELIDAGAGGTPLVMLPGGFGVAASSFAYIAALAPERRVVALHYPPDLDALAPLADALVALLDALAIGRAHLLGGSASGAVAWALARRRPDRAASLILAQTGPPAPGRAAWARLGAAVCARTPLPLTRALLIAAARASLPGASAAHRFWRAHFGQIIAAQTRQSLAARFRILADYDANHRLRPGDPALRGVPVAILEAAEDRFIPAAGRAALRAAHPAAWAHRFPRGAHHDSMLDPGPQIAAIRAAIAAAEALPPPTHPGG